MQNYHSRVYMNPELSKVKYATEHAWYSRKFESKKTSRVNAFRKVFEWI